MNFESDLEAFTVLQNFKNNAGILSPPDGVTWKTMTTEQRSAIHYLIDEWDYDFKDNRV